MRFMRFMHPSRVASPRLVRPYQLEGCPEAWVVEPPAPYVFLCPPEGQLRLNTGHTRGYAQRTGLQPS